MPKVGIEEADLDFLTEQRIPAFYGADDFIPDQEYGEEEALRCFAFLNRIFPAGEGSERE